MKKIEVVNEKVAEYLNSKEGQAIKVLAVFTIRKTPTQIDDNLLANADQAANTIANSLKEMAGKYPTTREALVASVVILENISITVNKKWLKILISIIKRFTK